jgi:hypothetical protein
MKTYLDISTACHQKWKISLKQWRDGKCEKIKVAQKNLKVMER